MEIERETRDREARPANADAKAAGPFTAKLREPALKPRLAEVSDGEARRVLATIEERFADAAGDDGAASPFWTRFRAPCVARSFAERKAFALLPLVVPDRLSELVLVLAPRGRAVVGYRGTISAIVALLGDSKPEEYCVVPSDVAWVLCENEHGVLMASGAPVEARLTNI